MMGHTRIWVHLVWATKNREPLMTERIRESIFIHIRKNAGRKDIYVDHINGYTDHMHVLLSLGAEQSIARVVQLIKGESSYWINKNHLIPKKFEWQDDYFAVSINKSAVNKLREYIRNQEEHHKKKPFQEEYEEFLENYGFEPKAGLKPGNVLS